MTKKRFLRLQQIKHINFLIKNHTLAMHLTQKKPQQLNIEH